MRSTIERIRFAMLWLVAGSGMAGAMTVFFYEPGVLEEGVAGRMEGEAVTMGMATLSAAMVALPLAMAVVTLFLRARASVITNLVVGVPFGAFGLFMVLTELAGGVWHAHLLLGLFVAAILLLIVGLSIVELRRPAHGDTRAAPSLHEVA